MNTTAPAVLMDVLTKIEDPEFQAGLEETGGDARPDGCRPALWELQYKLRHAIPVTANSPWLAELEHSMAHVMAAGDAVKLREHLILHAAITASWIQAIDARQEQPK